MLILIMAAHHFKNRTVLLVSKHGKERAIAPLLHEAFGMQVLVSEAIDTDRLGTFSGEIPRAGTQWEAAGEKLKLGRECYPDAEILLASEGAFHPHPDSPFITVNYELLRLHDVRNSWQIAGSHSTLENNAASITISHPEELIAFAEKTGFPETGIILCSADRKIVRKNLMTEQDLRDAFLAIQELNTTGPCIAETDLRAHRNPLRMESIRRAAANLIENMLSDCPACSVPGFSITGQLPGLPCASCGMPTRLTKAVVCSCNACGKQEERKTTEGRQFSDPMYCDYCNP